MPRLFAALTIPDSVGLSLLPLQAGLPGARWRPRENFHITLRFFGDVDTYQAEDIDNALGQIHAPGFDVRLQGVGQFGNERPRAVWAGLRPEKALEHLAAKIESAACRTGLPPETRKFMPHITLAYLKKTRMDEVQDYVAHCADFTSPVFAVDHFVLLQSHLGKGSAHYATLATYPLGFPHYTDNNKGEFDL